MPSAPPPSHLPRRRLGRTGREASILGFGGAPLGELYEPLDEAVAIETVVTAIESGVTLLDTSPLYGHGLSEHRIGAALRRTASDHVALCTKVGRVADPFSPRGDESNYVGGLPHALRCDYGYDGAMRSLEQSLLRLGRDHVDLVLVHDLDRWTHGDRLEEHYRTALDGAVKALEELRSDGVIAGYGIGVNEADMVERFARDCDPDVVLLAGRYSLLEQPALASCLPLMEERDIAVLLGGVFNSGILATGPVEGARYNYHPAPPKVREKAIRLETACRQHGVPLRRAALHFVLGHPAVASLVLGAVTPGGDDEEDDEAGN